MSTDTLYEPSATARKPKLTNLKRPGKSSIPKLRLDQTSVPSSNKSTSPVAQETAGNLLPLSYSADKAARYKTLLQEAQTAGGAVSMDFSGSTTYVGGKLTRKTIASHKITENMNNAVVMADKGITELRDAPNIEVTHKEVISATLESIHSQTKATENATIKMTDTQTMADGDLVIKQQATKILNVEEANVKTYAGNNAEIILEATQVIHVVHGQIPEAATNDKPHDSM